MSDAVLQGPRVVVTGLGALTPIGLSKDDYWNGLMEGRSGAAPIENFDASDYSTQFACELKGFDPSAFGIDRKEARRLDPFAQFGLASANQAIEDAGLMGDALSQEERDHVAVVFGAGIGGMKLFQEQVLLFGREGHKRLSPFFVPMMIIDIVPGLIAMRHKFRGPNYATVSACATSNHAIADGFMLIKNGLARIAICGGGESSITEVGVGGFAAMRALSTRNDSPQTASRPFDATRDGFVMGEGAGTLVLERLEHALDRGAHIYAEVLGLGMSADAHHISAPHPEGLGAMLSMNMALRTGGLAIEDVDYLNMHGTSTPLGDVAETEAIKKVFGDHAYKMNLSSTKSMTGHLLGAAGAIEAVATVLAIVHDRIPPTINFETPDPKCDLDYTFNKPVDRQVNVGLSNAFGFGGHNSTIAFGKYEE